MLTIRLLRKGKKNQPSFRIVVVDKKKSVKSGLYTEDIGFLNPLTKERKINIERAKYWLSVGAKPSSTVYNLFVNEKIIEGKKIPVHKKSKKQEESKEVKKEEIKTETAQTADLKNEEIKTEEVKTEEVKTEEVK